MAVLLPEMNLEHPLIGSLDHLSEQQALEQISALEKKLTWAVNSGNAHVCNQLRMALQSYRSYYNQCLAKQTKDHDYKDRIQIQ